MNLTLNIVSAVLILALSFKANPEKINRDFTKTAVLKFETEIIDYGTVEQYSDGNRTAVFTNEGDIPLIIANVKPTCGCTVADFTKAPILPGETGEIKIKYDTKRLGAFSKGIRVYSNAEGDYKILKIKGNVVAKN